MCKELEHRKQKVMSNPTMEATEFVRGMVEIESKGWGDEVAALRRIARESRLSFWTLNNLRIGRAKTVNADIRDRLRAYFVEHCRGHAARLLHKADMAAAKDNKNVVLRNIQGEIQALEARLAVAVAEASARKEEGTLK